MSPDLRPAPPAPHARSPRTARLAIAAALGLTVIVGVWLRWALAGAVSLPAPFGHLRHAHSHMGYYGVLFPLAWVGWRAAGVATPGRRVLHVYAASVAIAGLGFALTGYGPVSIAASTVIAAIWLYSLGPVVRRMARLHDPLGAVPLGLLASLACVPPVALTLRTDPALAHAFVSSFLAGLLFVVIIPSTLAARGITTGPWPLLLVSGGLGAAALGFAPGVPARVGLLIFAGLVVTPAFSSRLAPHARWVWMPVALGLVAMAMGVVPDSRPVALGAIHFLVMGPIGAALAPLWLPEPPSARAWWVGHGLWGTMSAALVAQAFTPASWTWTVAAVAGSGAALWWVWAVVGRGGGHGSETKPPGRLPQPEGGLPPRP